MNEQDPTVVQWVVGGVLSFLGWIGIRQVNRIDELEEKTAKMVTREELDTRLGSIHADVSAIRNHLMGKKND